MNLPKAPLPSEGLLVTHFIVVSDQARSRAFYADVLGGTVVAPENPCVIRLANSWIILNSGGGPTPDKPDVTLAPPKDRAHVSSFLNLRVANLAALYAQWKAKGADFLTEPMDNHGLEMRCYLRDPDGHLIELGEGSAKMVEMFQRHAG